MRVQSIDILRGLAASAVALAHADPRFRIGAIGVDIFFVISGFVMAHVCQERTPRQFIVDRIWRIYPLYWAVVLPFLIASLAAGTASQTLALNSLLLWPKWFGFDSSFMGVSWTLVYELAFYAAMAMAMQLRSAVLPLLMFAAAIAARPFTDQPLVEFAGHPIAVEFLFGIIVARSERQAKLGGSLLAFGLIWLSLFPNAYLHDFFGNNGAGYGLHRLILWGIPSALIVYGVTSQEEKLTGKAWIRPLLLLGAASYSIYLVHTIVVASVDAHWFIVWLASLATGLLLWRVVERPILRYRARLAGQRLRNHSEPATLPAG